MLDLLNKKPEILKLATKHGAFNIRIFGSTARGTRTPRSDVDILVSMKPGRTFFDLVSLWQDLEELLGKKVDVVSENGLSPFLKDQILAEAKPL